jgi:hypothetical protein
MLLKRTSSGVNINVTREKQYSDDPDLEPPPAGIDLTQAR